MANPTHSTDSSGASANGPRDASSFHDEDGERLNVHHGDNPDVPKDNSESSAANGSSAQEQSPAEALRNRVPPGASSTAGTMVSGALGGVEMATGAATSMLEGAVGGLTGAAGVAASFLPRGTEKPVKHITENTSDTVRDTSRGLNKTVTGATGGLRSAVNDSAAAASNKDVAGVPGGIVSGVGQTVGGLGRGVGDTLNGAVSGTGGIVGGPVGDVVSNVGDGAGNLVSGLTGGLGDGVDKFGKGDAKGGAYDTAMAIPKGVYGLGTGALGVGKKDKNDWSFTKKD